MQRQEKESIKRELVLGLATEPEVRRIVVFGSFLASETPNDLDVAVFQDSDIGFLPLALKYRARLRHLSRRIPLDIIPLRKDLPEKHFFLDEIRRGETMYER